MCLYGHLIKPLKGNSATTCAAVFSDDWRWHLLGKTIPFLAMGTFAEPFWRGKCTIGATKNLFIIHKSGVGGLCKNNHDNGLHNIPGRQLG